MRDPRETGGRLYQRANQHGEICETILLMYKKICLEKCMSSVIDLTTKYGKRVGIDDRHSKEHMDKY